MKRIRDILTRNKKPVTVLDDVTYKQVTIRTNYKGVILRGTQSGSTIGTKNQSTVSAGQFILSRIDARNGAFGIVPEELEGAIVTNDFLAFDINEAEVEREFFNVFLQSPQFLEACIKASRGNTNRKRVEEDFFLDYEVNLPALPEQQTLIQRINQARTHLSIAEQEIARQGQLLTKLKQTILQEAIQGKLTAEWRDSHPDPEPAHQLLQRIRTEKKRLIAAKKIRPEKPLPKINPAEIPFEIPRGWEWCRMGEAGVFQRGKSKHRPRNDPRLFENGDIPFVQTGDVARSKRNGFMIETSTGYYNEAGLAQSRLWPDGTMCITIAANIAETGFLTFPACIPDSVVAFTSAIEGKTPQFLRMFIELTRTAIAQFAPATAQKNINLEIINELMLPLPPLTEQAAIVERVEALMTTCRALEAEIERARTHAAHLLQAVLKEAFSSSRREALKIVPFPSGFARQLLAAEILCRHNDHDMTQMKLQKLMHVVEYHAQLDEIAGNYQRQAAGPYDNRMMYGLSASLEKQNWFKLRGYGQNAIYTPLAKSGQHQKYWSRWETKHSAIDEALKLLGKLTPAQCEIVSTLYAAWNDLLIEGKASTDAEIIAEASHPDRWHAAKAKIDPTKWPKALGWMRDKKLVPTAYGRHTRSLNKSS